MKPALRLKHFTQTPTGWPFKWLSVRHIIGPIYVNYLKQYSMSGRPTCTIQMYVVLYDVMHIFLHAGSPFSSWKQAGFESTKIPYSLTQAGASAEGGQGGRLTPLARQFSYFDHINAQKFGLRPPPPWKIQNIPFWPTLEKILATPLIGSQVVAVCELGTAHSIKCYPYGYCYIA